MRHGSNRRQRNRTGSSNSSGPNKSKVFDSNGPDVRIRGTAFQVTEKYLALAKDAAAAGDRVLEESYLQHAEHYQRVISSWQEEMNLGGDRSANSDRNRSNHTVEKSGNNKGDYSRKNDDLGLPSSILVVAPNVLSKEDSIENV